MANDPANDSGEPGERPHGWQCWASSISDTFMEELSAVRPCRYKSGIPPITFRPQCGSHSRISTAKEHAVVFVVCIHISRPKGNRGWQAIEVPQGWFNVIRSVGLA